MFNSLSPLQAILFESGFANEIIGLTATTIYHQIASYRDREYLLPPGKLVTTPDGKVRHLDIRGTGDLTVIVDASLGGVEGYLLIDELAKLTNLVLSRSAQHWES
jgi:hypothetical protein